MNTNLHELFMEPRKTRNTKNTKPIEFDGFRKEESLNG